MTILIVDDEVPAVQGVLTIIDWDRLGVSQTLTAYSYHEAVAQLQANTVDLLLTDIEMPGGSGFDLIEWANAHSYPLIHIILSSFPNFAYAQRAITLNVFAYLLKPIEDTQLQSTIQRALDQLRQRGPQGTSPPPPANPLIEQIKRYIYDNISMDISRKDVAEHVGLSPEYLSKFFKRETGLKLSDFINNERINFSKRLLSQTNLPIGIISSNVGYDSVAYFSSVFKLLVGQTPREYRKRHTNK